MKPAWKSQRTSTNLEKWKRRMIRQYGPRQAWRSGLITKAEYDRLVTSDLPATESK